MAVIRFSHVYPKLHGQKRATLVAVRSIRIDENTPMELLEYDTAYDGGHFPLPYGDYKQLVFIGDKGIPFCTIREHYPAEKGDYYDGSLGDVFEIKIKSEKEVAEQYPVKREIQSNDNMANLRGADLREAHIDYSAWPLHCGSLSPKIDKRIAAQLLYYALRAMQSCADDPDVAAVLSSEDNLNLANKFHQVDMRGRINPPNGEKKGGAK